MALPHSITGFDIKEGQASYFQKIIRMHQAEASEGFLAGNIAFFMKFAELTFVFPGVVSFSSAEHCYKLKLERFRKLICLLMLSVFLMYAGYLVACTLFLPSIPLYLAWSQILQTGVWMTANSCYIVTFFSEHKLSKILHEINSIEIKLHKNGFHFPSLFKSKYLIRAALGFSAVFYLSVQIHASVNLNDAPWNVDTLLAMAVVKAKDESFGPINVNLTIVANLTDYGDMTWWLVIKGTLTQFALYHAYFTEAFGDMLAVSTCISVCILVYTFFNGLDNSQRIPKEIILDLMEHIFGIFALVEDAVGWIVFFLCFGNLPFFASSLKDIFQGSFANKVIYGFYIMLFICINLPAAVCNNLLNTLPTWYRLHASQFDTHSLPSCISCKRTVPGETLLDRRFDILVQELSSREIGIRGKAFTVTFSFFGQVCSLAITYAVLLYQMQ